MKIKNNNFGYPIEPSIEIWIFFLKFGWIMAIENKTQKPLDF
jgi:hypothetical protein